MQTGTSPGRDHWYRFPYFPYSMAVVVACSGRLAWWGPLHQASGATRVVPVCGDR